MNRLARALLLAAALVALLSACTVQVRPLSGSTTVRARGEVRFGVDFTDVIRVFEPSFGSGASYRVGEDIAFRLLPARDGYVTLSAIDPDGTVYTFARNIYVVGGEMNLITGPSPREVFSLVPPRGFHRVRASFTDARTDTGRVVYRGRRGEDEWTNTITLELRPYRVRDVAETSFYLL